MAVLSYATLKEKSNLAQDLRWASLIFNYPWHQGSRIYSKGFRLSTFVYKFFTGHVCCSSLIIFYTIKRVQKWTGYQKRSSYFRTPTSGVPNSTIENRNGELR